MGIPQRTFDIEVANHTADTLRTPANSLGEVRELKSTFRFLRRIRIGDIDLDISLHEGVKQEMDIEFSIDADLYVDWRRT